MTTCADHASALDLLPLEVLTDDARASLDGHLSGCGSCQARAAALGRAYGHLRDLGRDAPPPPPALRVLRALDEVEREGDGCLRCGDAVAPAEEARVGPERRLYHVDCLIKASRPVPEATPVATPVKVSLRCSFCHGALARDEAAFCAACLAPHHADCFRQHGACSAPGCAEVRTLAADRAPAPRPRVITIGLERLATAAAALAVVGAAAIVAPSFFGRNAPAPPALTRAPEAAPPDPAPATPAGGPVVIKKLLVVADDFVVDIWVNGKLVPDSARHMHEETFGAMTESIDVALRAGDWVVWNVVNNRLRWDGYSYFGVAGLDENGQVVFESEPGSAWTACDDPSKVARFLASPHASVDAPAQPIEKAWTAAEGIWKNHLGRPFAGKPLWGQRRNTWVKHVVRAPSRVRAPEPAAALPVTARTGYPRALGWTVDPWNQAHWPVAVKRLGKLAWTYHTGAFLGMPLPSADGRVYLQGDGGGIVCLGVEAGRVLWAGPGTSHFNHSTAVLASDGTTFGSAIEDLRCLDRDGRVKWTAKLGAGWFHNPPVLSLDERTLYVGSDGIGLRALDAKTGDTLWDAGGDGGAWNRLGLDPEGNLLVGRADRIDCFLPDGRILWTLNAPSDGFLTAGSTVFVHHGSKLSAYALTLTRGGGLLWTIDLGSSVRGIALAEDGGLVASLASGELAKLSPARGAVIWRSRVSEQAKGLSPPATVRGGTLLADRGCEALLVDGSGRVVSRLALPADDPAPWRPAVGPDGRVYVATRHRIHAIDQD